MKKRRVRRKRKPPDEALQHAQMMLDSWETKRRVAETKVRLWSAKVKRHTRRLQREYEEARKELSRKRSRLISFDDD